MLRRKIALNSASCDDLCEKIQQLIYITNKRLQTTDPNATITLNYFRCYSYGNGNNEYALDLRNDDINCYEGIPQIIK